MSGNRFDRSRVVRVAGVVLALAVSGCANVGQHGAQDSSATAAPAPVAAGAMSAQSATVATAASGAAAQSAPVHSALPGPALVYRVKRGDTLARIARNHHCSVKQLLAWNGLKPSTKLRRGQVLHVASPNAPRPGPLAPTAPAAPTTASAQDAATAAQASAPSPAPATADAREIEQQTLRHANGVTLAWPAQGRVVEDFQVGKTRGIEIAGSSGDPVRAAAGGKVMYAGTGLNDYGSLIIVEHNKDFLTAYSHNRKLLVKTGDIVLQGQQIAEMGDEDNSRVSVGFELRHDGKPVDPMPYLPQGRG